MSFWRDLIAVIHYRHDRKEKQDMSDGVERAVPRLDHEGQNIRIIKAKNGTIIEYSEPYEGESALASAPNVVKRSGGRKLYIVPEGTKLADAILTVVGLMKLE